MTVPRLKRNAELRSACRTGKRRFRTEQAATNALERDAAWRAEGSTSRHEIRAYGCEVCDGWHLTSQPVPLKRTAPIKPRSAKTAKVYRTQRVPLVAELLAERPVCERCASAQSTEVHELLSRARGGSITDRANCVALCHGCHSWVTTNPAEAAAQGWLRHSWETSH